MSEEQVGDGGVEKKQEDELSRRHVHSPPPPRPLLRALMKHCISAADLAATLVFTEAVRKNPELIGVLAPSLVCFQLATDADSSFSRYVVLSFIALACGLFGFALPRMKNPFTFADIAIIVFVCVIHEIFRCAFAAIFRSFF